MGGAGRRQEPCKAHRFVWSRYGSQLLHRKVLWNHCSLYCVYTHNPNPRPCLRPWTSACNSLVFTFTRFKRRKPPTRLCKLQNLEPSDCELGIRYRKGLGKAQITIRNERGKYGLMIKNTESGGAHVAQWLGGQLWLRS